MALENDSRSRASVWKPSWFLSIRHWPNKGIVMHFQGFIFKKYFWIAPCELISPLRPSIKTRNVKIIFVCTYRWMWTDQSRLWIWFLFSQTNKNWMTLTLNLPFYLTSVPKTLHSWVLWAIIYESCIILEAKLVLEEICSKK